MSAPKVKTRTAEFFFDENRILWTIVLPEVLIDEHDALDNLLVIRNLTEGKPCLKIFDSRANGWKMTDKAKKTGKENYKPELTLARAIIINSSVGISVMNLMKSVFSGTYPVKYFKSEEAAIKWLLHQHKE